MSTNCIEVVSPQFGGRDRFIINANIPPEMKRQGFRFEVVDSTHPSDGGPVAISFHRSAGEAQQAAHAQRLLAALTT